MRSRSSSPRPTTTGRGCSSRAFVVHVCAQARDDAAALRTREESWRRPTAGQRRVVTARPRAGLDVTPGAARHGRRPAPRCCCSRARGSRRAGRCASLAVLLPRGRTRPGPLGFPVNKSWLRRRAWSAGGRAADGASTARRRAHDRRCRASSCSRCPSTATSCRSPASRDGRPRQRWSGVRLRDLAALCGVSGRPGDRPVARAWHLRARDARPRAGRRRSRAARPARSTASTCSLDHGYPARRHLPGRAGCALHEVGREPRPSRRPRRDLERAAPRSPCCGAATGRGRCTSSACWLASPSPPPRCSGWFDRGTRQARCSSGSLAAIARPRPRARAALHAPRPPRPSGRCGDTRAPAARSAERSTQRRICGSRRCSACCYSGVLPGHLRPGLGAPSSRRAGSPSRATWSAG